ncbi:MAG: M48 family metalloprotease [Thermodesulfobacteriota bacterium]
MLFAQIVAFVLVMAVFEAYRPSAPLLDPLSSLLALAALLAWIGAGGRLWGALLLRRLAGPRPPADPASAARRRIGHMQALAVAGALYALTGLDLKAHLLAWPLMAGSEALSGLAAALVFLACLAAAWWGTHPLERRLLGQTLPGGAYVLGQVRFVLPVVFPWLAMSLVRDLTAWLWPQAGAWLDSAGGDLVFLVFFLLLMALFFPPLVRWWWGCRPLPPGPQRELIQAVLDRAGVRVAAILTWPVLGGRLLTAGVLGLFAPLRYLLITPALLEALTPSELMGVAAHEAGHVRHRHLAAYLLLFAGFFALAYALAEPLTMLLNLGVYALVQTQAGLELVAGLEVDNGWLGVALALPLVLLLVLYLRYVMGFFMRHFERQADFFALTLLGDPRPAAEALERIGLLTGDSRRVPSWHHFSIAERSQALFAAAARPGAARRQALVIRRGLAAYLAGLLLLGGLGWGLGAVDAGRGLRQAIVLRVLEGRLDQRPPDARSLLALGVMQFEAGRQAQARDSLTAALGLAPEDPEVANALAWLLATARDEELRDPAWAVELALMAVGRAPEAHIWDTLAEAYFVAGQPGKAAAAARAAIAAGPRERPEYYRQQLERFERAAAGQREGD